MMCVCVCAYAGPWVVSSGSVSICLEVESARKRPSRPTPLCPQQSECLCSQIPPSHPGPRPLPGSESPSFLTSLWLCQQPLPRQEKEVIPKEMPCPRIIILQMFFPLQDDVPQPLLAGALNRLCQHPLPPPACSQEIQGLEDVFSQQPLGGIIAGAHGSCL